MVAPETQSHFLPSTQGNVQRSGKTKEPKPGTQTHGGPGGQQSLSAPVPPPQAYLEAGHTCLGRLMTNRIRARSQLREKTPDQQGSSGPRLHWSRHGKLTSDRQPQRGTSRSHDYTEKGSTKKSLLFPKKPTYGKLHI